MKSTFLVTLVCLSMNFASAQKSPIKYGVIPLEDLKMVVYDKDSSASAVILTDYGEAYISVTSASAKLNFERHVRIKILTKDGLEWANAAIPLYHANSSEEKVYRLRASTYNLENGKLVESEMSKDAVFKEKFNRYINLQKFTLPNVKEGSVIEYTYTVSSDYLANFPNWQFQYEIPVRWSEYWGMFPDFFIFEKYMQGYIAPTSYEVKNKTAANFNTQAHHWISKDVPAFKSEPFMTSEDDYVSKINLALSHINFPGQPVQEIMGTWSKLNSRLLESESFGKAITGSGFLKKKAEEVTSGITDPLQKVTAIFNYVQKNLEWDGTKDTYVDNLKKVVEDKKGTAADINIILASMLEKIDVAFDMVLISTRDHGFIRQQYPMEKQFNYVICMVKIGDKNFFLDATEKYLPMGILPERCLNGEGLVISKNNHGWIAIDAKAKARTHINSELSLNENGELKGKVNYTCDGYDAFRLRADYHKKGEADFVKEFLADKNWEIAKSEFQHVNEIDQTIKQTHEFTINEYGTLAGNVIYLNPFVTGQTKENIFKLPTREYPVDFGSAIEKTYLSRIAIPEGFTVDELPKPRVIILPNNSGKYTYNITQMGNQLNVVSIMQINKSLFIQDEYPYLREFYNQIVAKQAEQIVLKKK
ncbi:transglutaminase domain-containing protein [Chryseolinea sp. H1M3-3]|uniref:transglutaminase domain-containing protein n=1 Tax=Chryseolinea sp. H1M3-3 TaxID=3034144 RepID=UPI0023ED9C70|nr:transglutaminase domain-containing protein [Chryseolinea sp. H1M3-3]